MTDRQLRLKAEELFLQEEEKAERTVALLRIAIAVALAAIFVIVVRGEPSRQDVLIRQWIYAGGSMSGYLLLGVVSYVICRIGLYRPWFAWFAVTGDVLFLLTNIWLSLVNTGLPATLLVTIPPVWLAPVVLAFGALRFNPRLQIYVVAVMICGFAGFGLLGSWERSSVETHSAILQLFFAVPPNIMRLTMLLLAGVILVIASMRARALLARAIGETQRGINLTRYLPAHLADRLAEGGLDELRRGQRREVAVMFVDIREFTRQSEAMSPEEIGAFVTEFRTRLARAAAANNGTIDKFIGDAAMVVFGLVDDGRNHCADAVDCGRAILAEMSGWGAERRRAGMQPVVVGIGIHAGLAFCGAVGDESRLEFTVLGDTVNVAARLEAQTKLAGWPMIVSESVLAGCGGVGHRSGWRPLDAVPIRGRSAAVRAFGSDGTVAPPN